jgi:hypothetical protein
MLIYGSYVSDREDIVSLGRSVTLFDIGIAVLAGMLIIPAMYVAQRNGVPIYDATGKLIAEDTLIFTVLPALFETMGVAGLYVAFAFFVLMLVAALTSSISMLEVPVAYAVENHDMNRKRATFVIGGVITLVSVILIMNFGTLFGLTIAITTRYSQPLLGLLMCVFAGWIWHRNTVIAEIKKSAADADRGLKSALTANGRSIWENNKDAPCWNRDVIHTFKKPFKKDTGIAVLRGNLCPDGAIIKPSAATPKLLKHKARAVVFENIEDFHTRIDDPNLDIDAKCIMVLKNCGPKGYPGMAEVGNMPLAPKLLKKGITDMVRISDARMSGTAYGTVVLHVAPEAAAGGTLALVENGDIIELDVAKRRLQLLVSPRELAKRRAKWKKPKAPLDRGYWKLYFDHVLQAHEGADLDFLAGNSGSFVPRDNH